MTKNPANAGRRQGSNWKSLAASDRDNATLPRIVQSEIDVVSLLARRSGVAAATVRMHCEALGIGGRAHG